MSRRIVPLLNRIIIQKAEIPNKTAGGILLPETKDKDTQVGTVIAAGPGAMFENGRTRETIVRQGQSVLLPSYSGQEVDIDNEKFYIYKDTEILAILE
ncbi:unnamed protein product [Blepharisma stoltei]|uniref:20 kDa chaperonin, chloroplastic n=1 Tax=Blepharisma stoltei TaxID=1481888 RepID=A0AAU9KCN4_9CILI|nr:unnamed protein product [Blepharisma stoltei]